jgi:hypothetical protein
MHATYSYIHIIIDSGVTLPPEGSLQIFKWGPFFFPTKVGWRWGREETFFEPCSLKKGVQKNFPYYDN